MGRPISCNCQCVPPYPDCFGCLVYEPTEGGITDMEVEIGDTISWTSVEDSACTVTTQSWTNGFNCQIWGPEYGSVCGDKLTGGSATVRYHSVSPQHFSGVNALKKKPDGSCIWKKRRTKLLQQLYHPVGFKLGSYPGVYSVNECPEAIDTITYPYTDPVDTGDMWSPIVYPKPATSAKTGLPAIDSRCGTLFNASMAGDPNGTWLCKDAFVETTLELRISKLKVFSGLYGYACRNGQTVFAPSGTYYWELILTIGRSATSISCVSVITPFYPYAGQVGRMLGGVVTYQGAMPPIDRRSSALDLDACPPYSKTADNSWCTRDPFGDRMLYGNVLRWTKLVDCETDFLGDPIELTLDSPRQFVDSGDGDCECMDYEINAKKLGMTGYNTTAIVNPVYV